LNKLSAENRVKELQATEADRTAAAWEEVGKSSVDQLAPAQYQMAEAQETLHQYKEWRKVYGDLALPPTQSVKRLGTLYNKQAGEVLDTGVDNMNRFKKNALTLIQNVKNNPHIPGLGQQTSQGGPSFMRVLEDHLATKRAEAKRRDQFLADWRKLGATQASRVGELALAVDQLSRERGMKLLPSDVAKEAQFLGLTQDSLQFYFRMQAEFDRKTEQLKEALISRADRSQWADEAGKTSYIRQVTSQIAELQSRNYFPSTRFGNYVVQVKAKEAGDYKGQFYQKGDTLLREHYETKSEADERAASLRKQNLGQQHIVGQDKVANYSQASYQGMPPMLLNELLSRLPEDQHQAVRDAMAAAAPGQGYAKHLIRKKGVAGASKNFRKSFLSYMESFDRHVSRIREDDLFNAAIQDVEKSAARIAAEGGDASKRRMVQEMMMDAKEYLYNPGEEFRAWGALAFNYHLSGVPKHALLALAQLPMVSFPNLTAQYGTLATTATFKKVAARIYSKRFAPEKLPKALQDALRQAEEDGVLEDTLARESAALAQANNLDRLIPGRLMKGDTLAQAWAEFSKVAAAMFHHAEKFSRQITFHTAWELEYARTGDTHAAYDAARDAVQRGHFNFTAVNNPPIMRGKVRPLFVFQTHVQGMLEFLMGSNNPGKWRGLAMVLLAAGASGLPFAEDLEELTNWVIKKYNKITGDHSTTPDVKNTLRKELVDMAEWAGEDSARVMADVVLDGAGRWGFGLPWVSDMTGLPLGSFDLTPSLSLGQIVPGMQSLGASNWNDALASATEGVAGPAIGIPLGMMQAMVESEASGQWRLGKFLPAMIRNPATAASWEAGEMKDKYGRKVLDFDPNNPSHVADAIWQAIGMQPSRLSVERDARWAASKVNEYYAVSRTTLIRQMEDAVKSGEEGAIADVRSAIREYNATVPHPGYKLSPDSVISGIKARMKADLIRGMGLPQRKADIPATREMRESFPTETTGQ
jgi:hypothetical protein